MGACCAILCPSTSALRAQLYSVELYEAVADACGWARERGACVSTRSFGAARADASREVAAREALAVRAASLEGEAKVAGEKAARAKEALGVLTREQATLEERIERAAAYVHDAVAFNGHVLEVQAAGQLKNLLKFLLLLEVVIE